MINFLLKRKLLAYLIIGWAFLLGCLPTNVLAMPVSSEVLRNEGRNLRQADLAKIYSFLEKGVVQGRLTRMKLGSSEIKTRLSRLSDSQLHRLASQVDKVKLGEGAGGTILIVALVVGIILLILYLTGRSLSIETGTRKIE